MKPKVTFTTSGNSYSAGTTGLVSGATRPANANLTTNTYRASSPVANTYSFSNTRPQTTGVTFNTGNAGVTTTANNQKVNFGGYQTSTTNYVSPSVNRNEVVYSQGATQKIATSNVTPVHTNYIQNRTYQQPIQTGGYYQTRNVTPIVQNRQVQYSTGSQAFNTRTEAVTTGGNVGVSTRTAAVGATAVGATAAGATAVTQFGEYARPQYQRLYSTNCTQKERAVAAGDGVHKPSKCCGTPCWGLLGCLGLLGVILGMLFGLGVIGGLPSIFGDFNLPNVGGPSIGDLDFDGKPVQIAGMQYFSDSISTQTMMVQNNNTSNNTDTDKNDTVIIPDSSNTAFQFPPLIPIPPIVQPNQESTHSVDPIITSPVETAPVNSTPIVSVPTQVYPVLLKPESVKVQTAPVEVQVVKSTPTTTSAIKVDPVNVSSAFSITPISVSPIVTKQFASGSQQSGNSVSQTVTTVVVEEITDNTAVKPFQVSPTSTQPQATSTTTSSQTQVLPSVVSPISVSPTKVQPTTTETVTEIINYLVNTSATTVQPSVQPTTVSVQPTAVEPTSVPVTSSSDRNTILNKNAFQLDPMYSRPIISEPTTNKQPIATSPVETSTVTTNQNQFQLDPVFSRPVATSQTVIQEPISTTPVQSS